MPHHRSRHFSKSFFVFSVASRFPRFHRPRFDFDIRKGILNWDEVLSPWYQLIFHRLDLSFSSELSRAGQQRPLQETGGNMIRLDLDDGLNGAPTTAATALAQPAPALCAPLAIPCCILSEIVASTSIAAWRSKRPQYWERMLLDDSTVP
mmetsp:Transcript_18763/g.53481  ORF Transcript_18763/g.53481 Transcript_18763/m.53481 type:complete len:150 (+) Transcript_18763:107-556(+)